MKVVSGSYAISRSDNIFLQKKLASNASIDSMFRGDSSEDLFREGLSAQLRRDSSSGFLAAEDSPVAGPRAHLLGNDEKAEIEESMKLAAEYAARIVNGAVPKLLQNHVTRPLTYRDYFNIFDEIFLDFIDETIISGEALFKNSGNSGRPEIIVSLQRGIAEVHLELALLEACGRFSSSSAVRFGSSSQCAGTGGQPDIASCCFHLSQACQYGSCAAALALGLLRQGSKTSISPLLSDYVTEDLAAALDLLMLAAHRGSTVGMLKAAELWESIGGMY